MVVMALNIPLIQNESDLSLANNNVYGSKKRKQGADAHSSMPVTGFRVKKTDLCMILRDDIGILSALRLTYLNRGNS